MLWKTHVLIALFFCLVFLNYIDNKIIFISIALFSSLIPDIDSRESLFGKNKIFLPFQLFSRHRGFLHSFSFLFLIFLVNIFFISFWNYDLFFGFIIGFSSHLIADTLTIQGIAFFYPLSKKRINGFIRTGGLFEWFLFIVFLILNCILIYSYLF